MLRSKRSGNMAEHIMSGFSASVWRPNSPQSHFLRTLPTGIMLSGADFQPSVVSRLLQFMDDRCSSNRDWATFLLSQSAHSSPTIIKALIRNAYDHHVDVSAEAILGLAKRDRIAARKILLEKLFWPKLDDKDIEAAGYVGHRLLLRQLRRLQKTSRFDDVLTDRAIRACKSGKPENYGFD